MTAKVVLTGDELIATRYVDAAPALVWEMFTTPVHLAAFWGGDHATVRPDSVVVDLRVGGVFELETRSATGDSRTLRFQYAVIDAPRRLVLDESQTGLITEISLQSTGSGTTVVVRQRRLPPELQTKRARTGLAGILERLDAVARELAYQRWKGTT